MGLYERIKEVAKEKNTSVNKIEKDLGFARSSIAKFNKNRPSIDKMSKIAEYLDVSVDYLYGVEESEHVAGYYLDKETLQIAQEIYDNPDLHALLDAARGSRPDDLKMTSDFLKRLKGTNPDG